MVTPHDPIWDNKPTREGRVPLPIYSRAMKQHMNKSSAPLTSIRSKGGNVVIRSFATETRTNSESTAARMTIPVPVQIKRGVPYARRNIANAKRLAIIPATHNRMADVTPLF